MDIRLTSTIKVSRDEANTPKDTKPSKDAANSSMANSNKAVAEGVDRMHPIPMSTKKLIMTSSVGHVGMMSVMMGTHAHARGGAITNPMPPDTTCGSS